MPGTRSTPGDHDQATRCRLCYVGGAYQALAEVFRRGGGFRENGMELFAAFAGLASARGGRAVALAWKGLRPDAGCSMRFRARRGGGLSAAAAAVATLSCCRPVPASGCRYRAAAGDVVSAACGRGSGRVDVVV